MRYLILFLSLFLGGLAVGQKVVGKKCLANQHFTINYDKKKQGLLVYDRNSKLLNTHTFKGLPKFKKRFKKMTYVDPRLSFYRLPIEGLSNLYDLENYLIFTFDVEVDKSEYLHLLYFDKTSHEFVSKRIAHPSTVSDNTNNHYILGDRLYTIQINTLEIIVQIRKLLEPNEVLHQLSYRNGRELSPSNTPIRRRSRGTNLSSFERHPAKEFNAKKEQKIFRRLVKEGARGSARIHVNTVDQKLIELTIGTYYEKGTVSSFNMTSGVSTSGSGGQVLLYFGVVLDYETFAPISNEQLAAMEVNRGKRPEGQGWQ